MHLRLAASMLLASLVVPSAAEACGLAYPAHAEPPYLSQERVLVVWNEQTKVEHFVREVRFEKANQTFGFIVPTPGKPEVAKVEKSPFDDLEHDAPYPVWSDGLGLGTVGGFGFGGGGTPKGLGVQVSDVRRIGRFKAFTLVAHDAAGFRKWLDDNGFATTPELETWLTHYVDLGFHFVAFRFDGKKEDSVGMTSETVRISFESELPFYPYFEPRTTTKQEVRRLTTWFVSQHGMKPIATLSRPGSVELVSPWYAGNDPTPTVASFAKTLGELGALLPIDKPELQVQVFEDHKVSREGFHDVVFVPLEPSAEAKPDEVKHRAMARWLDPTVAKHAPIARPAPPPPPAPTSAAAAPSSCSHGQTGSHLLPFALALAWLLRSRRRAALGVVLLASCKQPAPAPTQQVTSAAPTASTPTPAESPEERRARDHQAMLLRALQGALPARVATEAGPWEVRPGLPSLGTWQSGWKHTKTVRITEKVTSTKGGELPIVVIRRILRANFPRFRSCYERGLKTNGDLAGTVGLRFVINLEGMVESSSVASGSLKDPAVATCMANVVRTLSFPDPEKAKVEASFTYELANK